MAIASQGDTPKTSPNLSDELEKFMEIAPKDYSATTQIVVSGRGDSSHVIFNVGAAGLSVVRL